MTTPINRSNIANQLVPGLDMVLDLTYAGVGDEHMHLFDVRNSSRSFEEIGGMTGLGWAAVKAEGDATRYDSMSEKGLARFVHDTVSLGFIITEEAIEDNQYDTASKITAEALGRSMAETKQQRAANYYNNGFTRLGGNDNQPLFSASHPTTNDGNQSNLLSGDLAEATIEAALIQISQQKNDRGMLTGAVAQKLLVPSAQMFNVHRILKSDQSTTPIQASGTNVSNANDINALRSMGVFPENVAVCRRFVDTDAWFIKTSIPNSTIMYQRVALQKSDEGDFDTGNFKYKARERYSFGHADWRGVYGSPGA